MNNNFSLRGKDPLECTHKNVSKRGDKITLKTQTDTHFCLKKNFIRHAHFVIVVEWREKKRNIYGMAELNHLNRTTTLGGEKLYNIIILYILYIVCFNGGFKHNIPHEGHDCIIKC